MSPIKVYLAAFATVSLIVGICFSFSLYLYFGVSEALRMVGVSVEGVNIITDGSDAIETVVTIENPSEFTLGIVFFEQNLRLNGHEIGTKWLSVSENHPIVVAQFSSVNVTLTYSASVSPAPSDQWIVTVLMVVSNPLPSPIRLYFYNLRYSS